MLRQSSFDRFVVAAFMRFRPQSDPINRVTANKQTGHWKIDEALMSAWIGSGVARIQKDLKTCSHGAEKFQRGTLRDVQFDVVDRQVGVQGVRVQEASPIHIHPGRPSLVFSFSLTLDAHRGVRQCIQPSHWNGAIAGLADPVLTFSHPLQGGFDLGQFAAFDLGKL